MRCIDCTDQKETLHGQFYCEKTGASMGVRARYEEIKCPYHPEENKPTIKTEPEHAK